MKKTIYWQAICNLDDSQFSMYRPMLERLSSKMAEGFYLSANLEQLFREKKQPLFSLRISKRGRVIGDTIIGLDKQSYFRILSVDLKHYKHNKFLKRKVLNTFRKKHPTYTLPDQAEEAFIEFTCYDEQQYLAAHSKFPYIVHGTPGTGKTASINLRINEWLNSAIQGTTTIQQVIVIAESDELRQEYADMHAELVNQLPPEFTLEYMNYQSWIDSYSTDGDSPNPWYNRLVSIDVCIAWIEKYLTEFKRNSSNKTEKAILKDYLKQTDVIYQRLRHVSGFSTQEDYFKNDYYPEDYYQFPELERKILFRLLQRILNTLMQTEQYHLPFSHFAIPPQPNLILLVEEAHDYSPRQSLIMHQATRQEDGVYQIGYVYNGDQCLHDHVSHFKYLRELVKHRSIRLEQNYRCSKAVSTFANRVLALNYKLSGYKPSKHESSILGNSGSPGLFMWLQDEMALKSTLKTSKHWAVIANPEFIKEAEIHFNTPLIYTPEKIKGLEYELIILYRLLDDPRYRDIATRLIPKTKHSKAHSLIHRIPLNQLVIASSRAITTLIFVQRDTHPLPYLINQLTTAAEREPILHPSLFNAEETNAEEWEAHLLELAEEGYIQQAQKIWVNLLQRDIGLFEIFLQAEQIQCERHLPENNNCIVLMNENQSSNSDRVYLIHDAIEQNRKLSNSLLKWRKQLNVIHPKHGSPLYFALQKRQYKSASLLIDAGANVNELAYGTPLLFQLLAIIHENRQDQSTQENLFSLFEQFINAGANINAIDPNQELFNTVLKYAIQFELHSIIDCLLQHKVIIDFPHEKHGALSLAIHKKQYATISKLVKHGANIFTNERTKFSPCNIAYHTDRLAQYHLILCELTEYKNYTTKQRNEYLIFILIHAKQIYRIHPDLLRYAHQIRRELTYHVWLQLLCECLTYITAATELMIFYVVWKEPKINLFYTFLAAIMLPSIFFGAKKLKTECHTSIEESINQGLLFYKRHGKKNPSVSTQQETERSMLNIM